jgi:phosphoglycolate phosphatase
LARNSFEFFHNIVCDKGRSLFVKHKTIKTFLQIHDVLPENAVYIGDESRDVVACKKAGVTVISVTWGWDSRDVLELVNPQNLIDSPEELFGKVAEILKLDEKCA